MHLHTNSAAGCDFSTCVICKPPPRCETAAANNPENDSLQAKQQNMSCVSLWKNKFQNSKTDTIY